MKKILTLVFSSLVFISFIHSQGLKGMIKKAGGDSTSGIGNVLSNLSGKTAGSLTNEEIIGGLKEALIKGTENGTQKLSKADGFFKDAVLKILMPEEAVKVENTLRKFGLGKQVDDAILSMNRAAEDAAKSAAPIFVNAVKEMNFQDAMSILKGGDNAATSYLQQKTTNALTEAFRPIIEASLEKVNATKHWNTIFTSYNKFSNEKVNTDLSAYVTERAMAGIFHMVALEEQKIRKDPLARTSDLLMKVFGN
jgi:hypothetical protein